MQQAHVLKGLLLGVIIFVAPTLASADTLASVKTVQLLPPGGASCATLSVSSVTPYVYDGHLDSFDIVVPDASYVAIGGSVGQRIVPFNHLTRSITPDGQLRIHGDVQSTPVAGSLAISVTLLSAANNITCASTISFSVTGPSVPNTPTVPAHSGGAHTTPGTGVRGGSHATSSTTTAASTTARSFGSLSAWCALYSHTLALWLLLLVLYAVLSGIAAYIEGWYAQGQQTPLAVALIIVPLLLLIGFWCFVPGCRLAAWVPILLLVIAIIGLLAAFREEKGSILLLTNTPSKPTIPLPAAAEKSELTAMTPQNAKHMEHIQKQLDEIKKRNGGGLADTQ